MANVNSFDFKTFNAMTKGLHPSLALPLAEGMLRDAVRNMEDFHNPLADEAREVLNEVTLFKGKWKVDAAERKAKRESTAPMAADGK